MSFVSFITEMAEGAGWSAVRVVSDTLVVLPFESDEGTVKVFIRPCGKLRGKTVLEFSSSGIPVPADATLKAGMMAILMVRNANLTLGHWAIEGSESDEPRFTVMATQIAETMDPAEFQGAVTAVNTEYRTFVGNIRKVVRSSEIDF